MAFSWLMVKRFWRSQFWRMKTWGGAIARSVYFVNPLDIPLPPRSQGKFIKVIGCDRAC
ncbi:hypothetical protein [Cylindrospermopsis raciborskii]|uniref:hypothetical protein n=1 Tax=Cylindrospermopsis raciborskii TaxID=77022 RepID=UPI0015C4D2B3|nr:hypothetical protein [Cylindrospermopsis raciborskii]